MKIAVVSIAVLLPSATLASPEAEQLFRDGRTLVKAKKYDEACDRFARSHKLEPSIVTLLNLGECYELQGRTASAWDTFLSPVTRDRSRTSRGIHPVGPRGRGW